MKKQTKHKKSIFLIVLILNSIIYTQQISAQYSTVGDPPYPPFNDICGNGVLDSDEECDTRLTEAGWKCPDYPNREVIGCNDRTTNPEVWCKCSYIFVEMQNSCKNGKIDRGPWEECDPSVGSAISEQNMAACNEIFPNRKFASCDNECNCQFSDGIPRPPTRPDTPPAQLPIDCSIYRSETPLSVSAFFNGDIAAKAKIDPVPLTDEEKEQIMKAAAELADKERSTLDSLSGTGRYGAGGVVGLLLDKVIKPGLDQTKKTKVPTIDPSQRSLNINNIPKTPAKVSATMSIKYGKDQTDCHSPKEAKIIFSYKGERTGSKLSPLTIPTTRLWVLESLAYLTKGIQESISQTFNQLWIGSLEITTQNLKQYIERFGSMEGQIVISINSIKDLNKEEISRISGISIEQAEALKSYGDKYILSIEDKLVGISEGGATTTNLLSNTQKYYFILTKDEVKMILGALAERFKNKEREITKAFPYFVTRQNIEGREAIGESEITIKVTSQESGNLENFFNYCCGNQPTSRPTTQPTMSQPAQASIIDIFLPETLPYYGIDPTIDPYIYLAGVAYTSNDESLIGAAPYILCDNTNLCNA